MTLDDMTTKLREANVVIPGKRLKLDHGPVGVIMLDGIAGTVTNDNGDADTTIAVSWDDWLAMTKGELDPMTAYMSGKLRIQGDMGLAMQMQGMLSKLKD